MTPQFTPLQDRVLIDPTPIEDVTKSGLIIVHTQTNSVPTTGVIVAIGPGRYDNGTLIPTTVKVGERVMWSKFSGTNLTIDGRPYLLMHEYDICGVI